MTRYPLAGQGVFATVQGEGEMLGEPMAFVRLAGCSVGCEQCDTDYRPYERLTAAEVRSRLNAARGACEWVWLTGGEPADHDLAELLDALAGLKVAVATAGARRLRLGRGRLDFASVSPHGRPSELFAAPGDLGCRCQVNLVPGLNGLRLPDWSSFSPAGYSSAWVTPMWYGPSSRPEGVAECVEFVKARPGWRLGVQAHKLWGLP